MKVKFFKKAGSAILAAALSANCSAIGSSVFSSVAADSTKYEFEDGTLSGATVQEEGTERYAEGASGDKFVFLQDGGETAAVTVTVEETGMYNITLCYSAPYGDKIHNLYVNGVDQGQFSCAQTDTGEWVELDLGSVKLTAGENEVLIKSSWGWTDIDYITIESSDLPDIVATQVTCCDHDATEEAQNLMSYLASVYGEHIISGQQEIYMYGPHDFEYEFEYIKELTGELPAIRGFDFLNQANILYGSDDGTTDRMIDWAVNKGGIVTASWHLTVPVDFTNYELGVTSVDWSNATYAVWNDNNEPATDFDTSNVIIEGTKEYEYYMACLEALASCIQELDDAGVPLIFRPLHEAEGSGGETGSWFWWGQDGSEVYKELWKLTYTTLTETYDLHNIIWEWNSYAYSTSEDWYPGDEYVDLIAYDKYNCTDWSTGSAVLTHNDSAISSTFYTIMEKYDSKKMVAMSENDSIPTLANLIDEKAGWLYFCPWYDGGSENTNFLTNEVFNTQKDLIEMYQSDYCITLGELPADLYTNGADVTTTTTADGDSGTTTTTTTTTTSDPDEYVFELFSETVDISGRNEETEYSLVIELDGTPEASVGGCVDYSTGSASDDWTNIEWSGNFDSDGKLTITVPLDDVSTDVTTAEVQVWWSNLWDSDTETANDVPCEITDITVVTDDTDILYGDADLSKTVDVTDAVKIMSYISNSNKYPMTDEQINVSDVNQRGNGIDILDALAIQRLISNTINSLPESYMEDE
ncbi:MAG: glycoside hydrolase [Ruminococcus sp.]|nr:glycoside hydrolase [Ruminococcus sp.]